MKTPLLEKIQQSKLMTNQLLTGKQFNSFYHNQIFVKLTNQSENHHACHFQTGLNTDPMPFDPQGDCQPGGIYFCLMEKIPMWLNYSSQSMIYSRLVTIPDDAQVWVEKDKFKADKIILGERQEISDLAIWEDPEYCLRAVETNMYALEYVKQQTPDICLAAVTNQAASLQFIKNQTMEICLAAVRKNGWTLEYVKDQTPEICTIAVKQNGVALQFVKEQTHNICLAAVQQNGLALQFVEQQTPEICLIAVKQNGWALKYVKDHSLLQQINKYI